MLKKTNKLGGPSLPGILRSYPARLLAATAMVAWIASGQEFGVLQSVLRQVSLRDLVLVATALVVGQALCAIRWLWFGLELGLMRRYQSYLQIYLRGVFASLFLPTFMGGDAYRAWALGAGKEYLPAVGSVAADRAIGLVALSWIGAVGSILNPGRMPGWIAAMAWVLSGSISLGFVFRRSLCERLPLGPVRTFAELCTAPRVVLRTMALSLVYQTGLAAAMAFLSVTMGLPISPVFFVFLSPASGLAGMSPITLGGLGERLAAMTLLLQWAGVAGGQATAFGLAWSAASSLSSLACGVSFLVPLEGDRR